MGLICSNCGNQIRENAYFCDNCGNIVNPEISSNNNFQISNQLENNLPNQQTPNNNHLDNEVNQASNNSYQNQFEQAYESEDDYSQYNEKQNNYDYNSEDQYNSCPYYSKEKLTFGIAIKNWWYGSFSGRCSRREWWFTFGAIFPFWFLLFFGLKKIGINTYFLSFPFNLILSFLYKFIPFGKIFPASNEYIKGFILYGINFLLLLITIKPQIALLTRRFHDLNMSGFWQIILWISTILDYFVNLLINLSSSFSIYLGPEFVDFCFNLFFKLLKVYYIIDYITLFFGLILVFAPGKIINNNYGPPSKY